MVSRSFATGRAGPRLRLVANAPSSSGLDMRSTLSFCMAFTLLSASMSGGCKSKSASETKPVAYSGTVTRADKGSVPDGALRLFPDDSADQTYRPTTKVQGGAFSDECLPGTYKVCLILPGREGGAGPGAPGPGSGKATVTDKVLAPYLDPQKTPWRLTIPADGK